MQLAKPDINDDDIDAVIKVLRSGRLSIGPAVEEFEAKIAEYVGAKHAIAVSSGTAALHLCIKCLNLPLGSEILVPSFTFVATVNAILYEGLIPVFVDITKDTFNIDPEDCEMKITQQTRAILAVDVFGHPAPWRELQKLSHEHNLYLIDDACEALGAIIDGNMLGTQAHLTTFAFYPNKQITTGEGGMIVTDIGRFDKKCRELRNHGRDCGGHYKQLGYNYRMSEMSAALGNSQLKRIEEFISKRRKVVSWYSYRLGTSHLRTPQEVPNVRTSPFVYVVLLKDCATQGLIDELESKGVPTRIYFTPIGYMGYHHGKSNNSDLWVTNRVAGRTLALPFHTSMTEADVDKVCTTLLECLEA